MFPIKRIAVAIFVAGGLAVSAQQLSASHGSCRAACIHDARAAVRACFAGPADQLESCLAVVAAALETCLETCPR